MRIHRSATPYRSGGGRGGLSSNLLDFFNLLFRVSLVVTVLLYGYLIWGLYSGTLANTAQSRSVDPKQVVQTIQTVSFWLHIALITCLVSACLLYYDDDKIGVILILIAAFLAFGLNFLMDFFASGTATLVRGEASTQALRTIHQSALFIGVPGVLLLLRHLVVSMLEMRQEKDFKHLAYGSEVARQERKRSLIPAIAPCWELPFCRDGIRVRCPIFLAKTRCWKERVGCMCEENIVLLAMEGAAHPPAAQNMAAPAGTSAFVPIGDLLASSGPEAHTEEKTRKIPTRIGPRGVRIPHNPNLSLGEKIERCQNCVIYNEHQRLKYNLLAPFVTLLVPLAAYWQYDTLKELLNSLLTSLDQVVGRLTFTGGGSALVQKLEADISGSVTVEVILIVCMTLLAMTLALRFLEFCIFKLKI